MRRSASIVTGAAALVAVALVAGVAGGCSANSCPSGTSRSNVQVEYGSTDEFVCVPLAERDDAADAGPPARSAARTPSYFGPSTSPSTADGGDAAPPACGDGGAPGDLDVRLVAKGGPPPAPAGAPPPDGDYVLAQANLYPSTADGGAAPPWTALRATMRISGALLDLTAEETAPAVETVEALAATTGGGALVKVCATPGGPIATSLVEGPPGATARASLGWDGATLDLVVVTAFGSMELVFMPP